MRANFSLVSVVSILDAPHYVRLKRISLFEQLIDAFRIRTFASRQSL